MSVVLLPFLLSAAASAPVVDPRIEKFFGRQAVAVLAHPAEVEVFRIASHDEEPKEGVHEGKKNRIDGFLVTRAGEAASGEGAEHAAAVLLNPLQYEFPPPCPPGMGCGSIKLCGGFHPGVALRFWSDAHHEKAQKVDVLLCFHCDDVGVFRRVKDHGKGTEYVAQSDMDEMDPNEIDMLDFGPGRLALLELAVTLLPDDPDLLRLLSREYKSRYDDAHSRLELTPALRNVVAEWRRKGVGKVGRSGAPPIHIEGAPEETLLAAARAAAAHEPDQWDAFDEFDVALVAVAKGIPPDVFVSTVERARSDRQALTGLARLFFFGEVWKALPEQQRGKAGGALIEIALAEAPGDAKPRMLWSIEASPNPVAAALLRRVVKGDVPLANMESWPRSEPALHVAAAIIAAQREGDADFVRQVLPGLPRTTDLDRAGIDIAAALLGDRQRLKSEYFSSLSEYVALGAVDAVAAAQGAAGMDALVDRGLVHEHWRVRERSRSVFVQLTAPEFVLPAEIADERHERQAGESMRTWWREHRSEFLGRHVPEGH